ncbi:MAG: pentapeptide repeat-containing protein [Tenacibaculum sp.]|nr:pentapeptide repeat-containing protein [Tenacibaculum sp.]
MEVEDKTIKELLFQYSKGKRYFKGWCIEENTPLKEVNLSNICFENCILFVNFQESKLNNTQFINCNIKEIDFSNADLTNVQIKNCSVESAIFKGANTNNLVFEENYCFGITLTQED